MNDEQRGNLHSAWSNLKEAAHRIKELLDGKGVPVDQEFDLTEIINLCNWAIDYLYRAKA